MKQFKAMLVRELDDGTFKREIAPRLITDLPVGDVLIKLSYSSLNYKDALSATGNKGVTKVTPIHQGLMQQELLKKVKVINFL